MTERLKTKTKITTVRYTVEQEDISVRATGTRWTGTAGPWTTPASRWRRFAR
jgi:hypothetical protein